MIKTLLINSIVIFAGAKLLTGVTIKNYFTALGVAVVLALLNVLIRPLILLLTLPLNILTLGLFTLVINAWIIMLADSLVEGLKIKSFGCAFLYSLVIALLNSMLLFIVG